MAPQLELDRRTLRLIAIAFMILAALSIHRLFLADAMPEPDVLVVGGETMGTTYEIRIVGDGLDDGLRGQIQEEAKRRLEQVDGWMSDWNPSSEISRFNEGENTHDFPVSPEMAELVAFALDLGEITGGAFDITVGPLVARWGFGSHARIDAAPTDDEVEALRSHIGSDRLRLGYSEEGDPVAIAKNDPMTEIDLSAVAKGYGVDHVARGLIDLGRADFLVEIGGEVRGQGERPGGGPWRVAIEKPLEDGRAIQSIVLLRDQSMATSGDYRIFYESAGNRLSHTIDPRTGRPVRDGPASTTVIADSAAEADAWATALMVMGEEQGLALADERGIAALLLLRDERGAIIERHSQAWSLR